MTDEPRPLTPDEFGRAVGLLLEAAPFERQLVEWGNAHAKALESIRESHPEHYHAARQAYGRRLRELKGDRK